MKLIIFDLSAQLAPSTSIPTVDILPRTDVRNIHRELGDAFVSPANSLGFMDGGIDYVLSRELFPEVEKKLRHAIKAHGKQTLLGRPYLPIGEALTIPTQEHGVFMIAAPTMWLPYDVSQTHNAYHAMYAVLQEASKNPDIRRVYCPALCTGYGKMSYEESLKQMLDAYADFSALRPAQYSPEEIVCEQPNVYMYTEFKPISHDQISQIGNGNKN